LCVSSCDVVDKRKGQGMQGTEPTTFGVALLEMMRDHGVADLEQLARLTGLRLPELQTITYADAPDAAIPPNGFGLLIYETLKVTHEEQNRLNMAFADSFREGFKAAAPGV
jgi:hypothetical protein